MSPEPALASLASEVDGARHALLEAALTRPGHAWTVDDLVHIAHGSWRDTVVMIALDQLLTDKALQADAQWHVVAHE